MQQRGQHARDCPAPRTVSTGTGQTSQGNFPPSLPDSPLLLPFPFLLPQPRRAGLLGGPGGRVGSGMVTPRGKADKRPPPTASESPRPPGSTPSPPGAFRGGPAASRGIRCRGPGDGAGRGDPTRPGARSPRSETFPFLTLLLLLLFCVWRGSAGSCFLASLRCDLSLSAVAPGSNDFISQRLQNKNFFKGNKQICCPCHAQTLRFSFSDFFPFFSSPPPHPPSLFLFKTRERFSFAIQAPAAPPGSLHAEQPEDPIPSEAFLFHFNFFILIFLFFYYFFVTGRTLPVFKPSPKCAIPDRKSDLSAGAAQLKFGRG